jgi:hypothetical protein
MPKQYLHFSNPLKSKHCNCNFQVKTRQTPTQRITLAWLFLNACTFAIGSTPALTTPNKSFDSTFNFGVANCNTQHLDNYHASGYIQLKKCVIKRNSQLNGYAIIDDCQLNKLTVRGASTINGSTVKGLSQIYGSAQLNNSHFLQSLNYHGKHISLRKSTIKGNLTIFVPKQQKALFKFQQRSSILGNLIVKGGTVILDIDASSHILGRKLGNVISPNINNRRT